MRLLPIVRSTSTRRHQHLMNVSRSMYGTGRSIANAMTAMATSLLAMATMTTTGNSAGNICNAFEVPILARQKEILPHHPSTWTQHRQRLNYDQSSQFCRLFSTSSSSVGSGGGTNNVLLDHVLKFRGVVATGYGRGGKKLGVPTANLPSSLFQNALTDVPTGVYFGWAALEQQQRPSIVHKAVVNVGYSPTFEGQENKEKIIEAHLIVPEEASQQMADFYGVPMRLQLVGYLRPEQKFGSFDELIAQIHADIDNATTMLDEAPYSKGRNEPFLDTSSIWVGDTGGDDVASWQFTPARLFLDSLA